MKSSILKFCTEAQISSDYIEFNIILVPENSFLLISELQLVRQLTAAALSATDPDDEKGSVDSLDAIHPRMRPKSEIDLQVAMRAQVIRTHLPGCFVN